MLCLFTQFTAARRLKQIKSLKIMKTQTIKLLTRPMLLLAVGLTTEMASAQCTPPPSGLVAWWRGEGNAQDAVGFSDGTLIGDVNFVTGRVGQTFNFSSSSSSYISVPDSQLWDLGTERLYHRALGKFCDGDRKP